MPRALPDLSAEEVAKQVTKGMTMRSMKEEAIEIGVEDVQAVAAFTIFDLQKSHTSREMWKQQANNHKKQYSEKLGKVMKHNANAKERSLHVVNVPDAEKVIAEFRKSNKNPATYIRY